MNKIHNNKNKKNISGWRRAIPTVLAILLLLPVAAKADIVIEQVVALGKDGVRVLDIPLVEISGSNRALVVAVLLNDNDDQRPTSVEIVTTPSNIPLIWLSNAYGDYQDDGYCRIYGVKDPPVGTFTVRVTLNVSTQGDEGLIAGAWSLTGVDQANPFRTAVGEGEDGGTMRVTVTSAINDMVLGAAFVEGYDGERWCEGNPPEAEDWDITDGPLENDISVGQSKAGAAGSTQINYTYGSNSDKWVAIGVAVRPAITTIGDGTSPANKDVNPNSTNNAVDAFTLYTNSTDTIDTVTALEVTFSGTAVADVASSGVKIYDDSTGGTPNEWDAGDTLKGTASFSGDTASVTVSISVDSTPTQYLVTYDIAIGATDTNTLQGAITDATVSNILVNSDSPDATLTVTVTSVELAGSWVTGTTHTAETGSDRVLILVGTIQGYGDGDCTISSASYGGEPLTFIESRASSDNDSNESVTEVWYLNEAGIAAAIGSTFSVTWIGGDGGPNGERYMSGFYTGVSQTTPIGAKAENYADAATPNPITTSALSNSSGDMVIVAAGGSGRGSYTAQNGFTEQQEDFWDDGDDDCLVHTVADKAATGSNETPSIQHTGMWSQQIIGFVLQFATTTIEDGTSPADNSVAPDSTNNAVDAFTLVTNTEPETVTALEVTFTGTDVADVASSGVKIYDDSTGGTPNEWDAGDTLKGTASFSGTTADVTVSISVDTSATQYLVTYDIASGATASNTLQGAITDATVTNTLVNNDATDATLTITASTSYNEEYALDTKAGAEADWDFVGPTGSLLQDRNTAGYWDWSATDTPSSDVGPTAPQGGSAGYVYTETSNPTALDDEFTMTLSQAVDGSTYALNCSFYRSMDFDGDAGELHFEVQIDGGAWQSEGIWYGGTDASWVFADIDLSAYNNSTLKVRFRTVVKGTNWHNDCGIDTVRIYGDMRAPPTTTIEDGTSPANKNVGPDSTKNAVDAFTLVTNNEPETVTALEVTFTGTAVADVASSGVKIYEDSGSTANEWDATDTLKGTASFSGTTADVTVSISVDSTPTQYLVTYDIASGATASNTLQGAITDATVTNTLVNNDTTDATLTISDCTFLYRKPITIQPGQVIGSADHLNFPMLVSLSGDWLKTTIADPTNGRIENASGDDIIFKDTNLVQLDHEIEDYDGSASGGTLVAWVRIPILDYDDDTVIYMYYGNPCIDSSTENVTGVWNSNYKGVWHLKETPSVDSYAYDSTENDNDGLLSVSMTTGNQVAGQVDGSLNFTGLSGCSGTDTFTTTGSDSLVIDSSKVGCTATITVKGAGGGGANGGYGSDGGAGGGTQFDYVPGTTGTFDIFVGGGGGGGSQAGGTGGGGEGSGYASAGGGGASAIKFEGTLLAIAGGGGGGGYDSGSDYGGDGGSLNNAGGDGQGTSGGKGGGSVTAGTGGFGGTGSGGNGGDGGSAGADGSDGTGTSPGVGGTGVASLLISGGGGGAGGYGSGAGGGGYGGGGAAGDDEDDGAGAGGGGYLNTGVTSNSSAVAGGTKGRGTENVGTEEDGGNGSVEIVWSGGSGDYLDVGNAYDGVKTVTFWINADSTTEDILDLNGTANVNVSTGTIAANFTSPIIYVDGAESSTIDTNWHHVAITTDSGINASAVDIGRISASYLLGKLDEVRISDIARLADWIETEHNNQKASSTFFIEGDEDVLGDCSYSYYKPITIDFNEVFGSSDHTDFPFLVNILSDNDLRTKANNGDVYRDEGWDIIFRDSYGRQLDHEIEDYVPTSGKFVAWVRIPTLSLSVDTVIYMYYGSSCIGTSQENAAGVWDDNYAGVWHLSQIPDTDGGTDEILDSNNSNHGDSQNMASGDQVAGRIDGSLNFNGSNNYITIVANAALDLSTNFTVSAWFYKNTSGAENLIYSAGTTDTQYWTIRSEPADKIEFNVDGTGGWESSTAIGTGAWHHMAVVKDGDAGTNMSFYVDGQPNGTATVGSVPAPTGQTRAIGYRPEGNDFYWGGILDEVRVSSTPRSAGWIKTCYYNQKDNSSFYIIGDETGYAPTAVDLISFTATGQDESILVEWETAQEIDNLGFNLYRSSDPYGSYSKLNNSLIPGLISSVTGRKYTYIDTGVTRDVLYYYMLEDVDLSGTRTMHGPICVDWDGDGIPDGDVEDPDDDEDEDTDDGSEVRIPELRFEEVDFGPEGWTPSSSSASWVKLSSFRARQGDEGIALEWETSFEVDNFGFHVYRELDGKFYRITPDLVPGSVFKVGAGEELPAGQSYMYWDGLSEGTGHELYWLDCVELNGGRASFGPIKPEISGQSVSKRQKVRFRSIARHQTSRARVFGKVRALREELSTKPIQTQSSKATIRLIDPEEPSEPRLRPNEEQWALSAQSAVKIYIRERGWYRVGQPELVAAGLSPDVDPRYLQLYADGEEQSMMVTGSDDGRFDPLDVIEFYGTRLDKQFTDAHVYWLVVGSRSGRRVDTPFIDIRLDLGKRMRIPRGLRGRGAPLSFPFYLELKERTFYFAALKNGEKENFFGSLISTEPVDQLLTVAHPDLSSPEDAMLRLLLQGATDSTHQIKVLLNYVEVGDLVFSGQERKTFEIQVPHDLLLEGDNIVTLTAQGGSVDVSLVDRIRLNYWRTYTADEDILRFKANGGEWLSIGGFSSSEIQVVDITDPMRMINIRGKVMAQDSGYAITVKVPGAGRRILLAFTEEAIKSPAGIEANLASSWHEVSQGADVIIIGHSDLLESVEFLKQLREQQGWSVVLVDVEDLYDEFNFGAKSPWAMKDFLAQAYQFWNPQPRFVLLVGDASYDPRNYLGFGEFDLVPTKFVDTGRLTTASDDWFVDFDDDGLPEMAMGRLPVENAEEAETVVSKIIAFESVAGLMNEALLVADINDFIDFEGASADVAEELLAGSMEVSEILRGRSATARTDLLNLLNQGQLLVNYIGHGSTKIWNGNLLTSSDAWSLTNSPYLPFLVSMTCLNGFFQDPYSESLAETFLKAERGGAVAVWTSSGLTLPGEQALMNLELIRLLFNGEGLTIGEAVIRAKRATTNGDIRRTWILFGDPTLRLR